MFLTLHDVKQSFVSLRPEMSPGAHCRDKRRLEAARAHLAACTARRALRAWAARVGLRREWLAALHRASRQSAKSYILHGLREALWCAAAKPWQRRTVHMLGCISLHHCNDPHRAASWNA